MKKVVIIGGGIAGLSAGIFAQQKGYKSIAVKNTIKGLSNVILASQWLSTNGGLPMAATSGKFAAQKLPK